jgi:hypothetical protein
MGGRPLASAKGSRGGHGSSLCQPFPRINPGQFGRRASHQRGQPVNCCPLQRRTKAASLDRSEDGYFSLPPWRMGLIGSAAPASLLPCTPRVCLPWWSWPWLFRSASRRAKHVQAALEDVELLERAATISCSMIERWRKRRPPMSQRCHRACKARYGRFPAAWAF